MLLLRSPIISFTRSIISTMAISQIGLNMRRRLRAVLTLAIALTLLGCPQRVFMWLNSNPSAQHLVFHIGSEHGKRGGVDIAGLRVDRCDQPSDYRAKPLWMVGSSRGTADIDSVVYGAPPQAFDERPSAPTLTPGCYRASTSGFPGEVKFDVLANGSIRERAAPR